jgi:hypothetical protein
MDQEKWTHLLVDIVARATSRLPEDMAHALREGRRQESPQRQGAVYLHAVDGIAQLLAHTVTGSYKFFN